MTIDIVIDNSLIIPDSLAIVSPNSKAFNLLNSIAITLSVQDIASGDKYAITSKSKTGFNIAFTNSGGTGVSRTFDYVAKGV